jgi:ribosome-binding factor A
MDNRFWSFVFPLLSFDSMSRRTERLGSTIQQELAQIIMRELNDPRLMGMPSITRVKVSPDLSVADVYVTIMGTPGQQNTALNALRHSAGLMRTKLTKILSLRVTPFLKFHMDEDLKKELTVLNLLEQVARENAEIDRKRAEAANTTDNGPSTTDNKPNE